MKRTRYVEMWYPGIIMSEPFKEQITADTVIKPGCYAVRFYTKVEQKAKLENGDEIDHTEYQPETPLFYIDGKIYTRQEILDDPKSGDILRSNVKNNYEEGQRFVQTRNGQMFPLHDDEEIKALVVVQMALDARKPDTSIQ